MKAGPRTLSDRYHRQVDFLLAFIACQVGSATNEGGIVNYCFFDTPLFIFLSGPSSLASNATLYTTIGRSDASIDRRRWNASRNGNVVLDSVGMKAGRGRKRKRNGSARRNSSRSCKSWQGVPGELGPMARVFAQHTITGGVGTVGGNVLAVDLARGVHRDNVVVGSLDLMCKKERLIELWTAGLIKNCERVAARSHGLDEMILTTTWRTRGDSDPYFTVNDRLKQGKGI